MLRWSSGRAASACCHLESLQHAGPSMHGGGGVNRSGGRGGSTCSGFVQQRRRKGNCWDNAPTESWFNSFKNERYHGIRYASHDAIKVASFEYIEVFYNRTRQHSTLGYRSPVQYREDWMKKQNQENLAA